MFSVLRHLFASVVSFFTNWILVQMVWVCIVHLAPYSWWSWIRGMLRFLHIAATPDNIVCVLTFLTLVAPCLLSWTNPGQRIMLWSMGARRAEGQARDLLEEAFAPVCKQEGTDLKNYNLYVIEDQIPNAMAFGKNNIIATRGILGLLEPELLTGILAHEAGHIHNGDTAILILQTCMGFFGNLALKFFYFVTIICGLVSRIPYISLFAAVLSWLIAITTGVFHLVVRLPAVLVQLFFSRQDEYNADRYACELGFGEELYAGLQSVTANEESLGFFDRIWSTHPITKKRLERIRKFLQQN